VEEHDEARAIGRVEAGRDVDGDVGVAAVGVGRRREAAVARFRRITVPFAASGVHAGPESVTGASARASAAFASACAASTLRASPAAASVGDDTAALPEQPRHTTAPAATIDAISLTTSG
jgi:hypothetical protein